MHFLPRMFTDDNRVKFTTIPAKAGIQALTVTNHLPRAWAPDFVGVAIYQAFP